MLAIFTNCHDGDVRNHVDFKNSQPHRSLVTGDQKVKYDFVVLAGEHERVNVPVRGILPTKENFPPLCILRDAESDKFFLAQTSRRSPNELEVSFIVDHLPPKAEMEALLTDETPSDPSHLAHPISVSGPVDKKINILIGGHPFTTYYFGGFSKPFLYPLNNPFGTSVTRSLNEDKKPGETTDHVHHRSVWTAYGNVNGHDYWGEGKNHGLQVAKSVEVVEKGPVCGTILSRISWETAEGDADLTETRRISLYGGFADMRIIDFNILLTAENKPVKFGDTKEGGILALRVATTMDVPQGGKIQNAVGGVQEEETWGKQAAWCDYSGKVQGQQVGVAIFDHPDNPTFPMYWHVRNYGLMAANPWGLSEFRGKKFDGSYTLDKGKTLDYKFRLLVHKGDAVSGDIATHYLNYAIPPKLITF